MLICWQLKWLLDVLYAPSQLPTGADPGGGGGLRVLKHPPKLPKVNYLLLLLILSTYSLNSDITN